MLGLMQSQQLLISSLIEFAERHHGEAEIVSRRVEGDIHRYTYKDVAARARKVANALDRMELAFSDRVATLAWNGYRHLELYFGVSGTGRVLHTLNPRLHPDQIVWIANHAEDQVLCFDMTFLPIVKAVHGRCTTIKHFIALCDADKLPADTGIPGLRSYEEWIGSQPAEYAWPEFDENSASSMCYTSGTTGHPKGALYSHRSSLLHAYGAALPDAMGCSAGDVILPVVPMFHVNAWGLPVQRTHGRRQAGVSRPLPRRQVAARAVRAGTGHLQRRCADRVAGRHQPPEMCRAEDVQPEAHRDRRRRVSAGHAADAGAGLRRRGDPRLGHDRTVAAGHAVASAGKHAQLPDDAKHALLNKQGRAICGIDLAIVGDDGQQLPWDGCSSGDLLVRGAWVIERYFGEAGTALRELDGEMWFATGDVATIDADGFMQITDRSKDVIKSGGEWISSIDWKTSPWRTRRCSKPQ
jgi:acyl-CoA synthetase (AMP-forming)/AMP-acid ligase II